jgi:hypothetical protein
MLMVLARFLVTFIPFRLWRDSLGAVVTADRPEGTAATSPPPPAALACAHAMQRAAVRLRGTLCLPRAMTLQWMLRRRGIGSTLAMGVVPEQHRGGLDDLHAWVEIARIAIMDEGPESHRTVLRLLSKQRGNPHES